MTIEEIKKTVFEKVAKNEDLKYTRSNFYEVSGVEQLQFEHNGWNLIMDPSELSLGSTSSKKNINFDSANPSLFVKEIQEYTDRLNAIENDWNALVREATVAAKIKDLGKMGLKSILQAAFDGQNISYDVNMSEEEGGNADISIRSNLGKSCRRSNFELSLNLPTNHPQTMAQLQTLVEKVKNANMYCAGEETTTMKFVEKKLDDYGQVLSWYSRDEGYDDKEENNKRQDIYDAVIAAGRNMDFQSVANTKEQLLAALANAGINAEMVQSPYCHTQKDIKITDGEFTIIITNGKTSGMLVACSPFFATDYKETINICVSHCPQDQVVQWVKDTCEKLSPIANELIPAYRMRSSRKRDMSLAKSMMKGMSDINGVCGYINKQNDCNCELTIEGIGTLEMGGVDIQTTDPIPFVSAIIEIAKCMSEIRTLINVTE